MAVIMYNWPLSLSSRLVSRLISFCIKYQINIFCPCTYLKCICVTLLCACIYSIWIHIYVSLLLFSDLESPLFHVYCTQTHLGLYSSPHRPMNRSSSSSYDTLHPLTYQLSCCQSPLRFLVSLPLALTGDLTQGGSVIRETDALGWSKNEMNNTQNLRLTGKHFL